jgi:hypothetical protein
VDRYSFTVTDFHRLPPAGLPGAPRLKFSTKIADALFDKSLSAQLSREAPTMQDRLQQRDEVLRQVFQQPLPPGARRAPAPTRVFPHRSLLMGCSGRFVVDRPPSQRTLGEPALFGRLAEVRGTGVFLSTNRSERHNPRDRSVQDFRRWKNHDAYKQSFERVMRDLTVKPKAP